MDFIQNDRLFNLEHCMTLEDANIDVYWKDTDGSYLGINDQFLHMIGVHSYDEVIGKSDSDLLWKEHSALLIKNDNEVMRTGQSKIYLEGGKIYTGETYPFLSLKKPLFSNLGKIIGIFGISILVEEKENTASALKRLSWILDPFNINHHQMIPPCAEPLSPNLTSQQFKCLLHLVKGMTIKQIATELTLSPKTVEHYLDAVKIKLNCHSRSELIGAALKITEIRAAL